MMELEDPTAKVKTPNDDKRPHMPEPPPVRLLAIADMRLPVVAGLEKELDRFYVGLLKFERDADDADHIAYRAERWRVVFSVVERPPARVDYRPVMVQIPHFDWFVDMLKSSSIEFEWQKGVAPGVEAVLLKDPAGSWVSVSALREIS